MVLSGVVDVLQTGATSGIASPSVGGGIRAGRAGAESGTEIRTGLESTVDDVNRTIGEAATFLKFVLGAIVLLAGVFVVAKVIGATEGTVDG